MNSPVEQANKEAIHNEVETVQHEPNRIFGLGVPRAQTSRPVTPMFEEVEERTQIPQFRTARIISQEGLFALALGVMEERPA